MLIMIFLTYWGRMVFILKGFVFLCNNLILQDTKSFSITNRLWRVFFMNIQKISNHLFQVYIKSHLLPLNPPYNAVPKASLHQITWMYLKCHPSDPHQKLIISNETFLTISVANIIVSEIISFNISHKLIFKKVMELARNVSNTYTPPNRNLKSKKLHWCYS